MNIKMWPASLCLLVTLTTPVSAQTLAVKPSAAPKDGVEGLVVNSTISANGMAFFVSFLDFWRVKQDSEKYTLDIAESASKRLGNQVWVSFGQKRVFFSTLPIQRERIRLLSEQAADTSYEALKTLVLPFGTVLDTDMADDEL
jgi:hypothetical protein